MRLLRLCKPLTRRNTGGVANANDADHAPTAYQVSTTLAPPSGRSSSHRSRIWPSKVATRR